MIRMLLRAKHPRRREEAGIALVEVLVSLFLALVTGLALAYGLRTALVVEKFTESHFAASALASSRIEELAAIDIAELNASYNETDTEVEYPNLNFTFLRSTGITVNADDSRTIEVRVRTEQNVVPVDLTFVTRFAVWE